MTTYDRAPRNTWVDIDLKKLEQNIRALSAKSKLPLMVLVNGNAYGHGLVASAKTAVKAGAKMLGVATAGEALVLREHGINADMLCTSGYGLEEIEFFIKNNIHFFVWRKDQMERAQEIAAKKGQNAKIHIKIDSGMGRLGIRPLEIPYLVQSLMFFRNIEIIAASSHFSESPESARTQLDGFRMALGHLVSAGVNPPLVHLALTPGLLEEPVPQVNMLRAGFSAYGLLDRDSRELPQGIVPVAQWKAKIVSVRQFGAGEAIGHSTDYVTSGNETIAIIPVGYADGLRKPASGENLVLIRGRRLPIIGGLCMDQSMVLIPGDMRVTEGEEAVIIGQQQGEHISAKELAARWGSSNVEIMSNISERVPRIFHE